LSPAADTPSSARLFDAIVSGCIPVIVSDELELGGGGVGGGGAAMKSHPARL